MNIYHANMLRSFDMGVRQTLDARRQKLTAIDGWVEKHARELEISILQQEMRLQRLREMQIYFSEIHSRKGQLARNFVDDSYNVWNFGHVPPLSPAEHKAIELLAGNMPFSYIAIRVSLESLLAPGDNLDISIGLGILEQNRAKLALELPPEIPRSPGGSKVNLLMELADPFYMTKRDIAPLLEELRRRDQIPCSDLVGRIFISYMKDHSFVHGVALGFFEEE